MTIVLLARNHQFLHLFSSRELAEQWVKSMTGNHSMRTPDEYLIYPASVTK